MALSLLSAEREVAMIVIDMHYLAGLIADVVIARRVRDLADKLHDTAMEMRGLDSARARMGADEQEHPAC